jgi:uncharacterized RDD family membrane protein YckC
MLVLTVVFGPLQPDRLDRFVISSVINFGYLVPYWIASGATPGKKLMRLRVVDADTGELITYRKAALRWAGYLASSLSLGLGFLWIGWDSEKQGWHDKIAGTHVVRVATAARDERTIII